MQVKCFNSRSILVFSYIYTMSRFLVFLLFTSVLKLTHGQFKSDYSMVIVQDGNRYELSSKDTLLILKPTEFHFEFEILNREGVYLSFAYSNEFYSTHEDSVWKDFESLNPMVMVEESNNSDKDAILADDGFSYWFYSDEYDWHRLDEGLKVSKGKISGTYTINKFYDRSIGEEVGLDKIDREIFVLFFESDDDENRKPVFPYNRKRVRLKFE